MIKNSVYAKILFLSLIIIPVGQLQAQKGINRYAVKDATISYKYSGMSEGEGMVYIADYGKKEAHYTKLKTSAFGFSTETNELELNLGDVYYTIDLNEKTGTKLVMTDDLGLSKKEIKEYEELGKEMMEEMGFEKTGEGTILGKKCDIWEGMGTKTWIWKNISLKMEMNMMGKMTVEATKIDLRASIPASKFKVPDGIRFEEIDAEDGETYSSEDLEKELKEGLDQLKGILGTKKKKK